MTTELCKKLLAAGCQISITLNQDELMYLVSVPFKSTLGLSYVIFMSYEEDLQHLWCRTLYGVSTSIINSCEEYLKKIKETKSLEEANQVLQDYLQTNGN